jgi:glutamate-1-semialdehyde 2,1-aminomutase
VQQIDKDGISHFNRMYHKVLDQGLYLPPSGYEVCFISAAHTSEMLADAAVTLASLIKQEAHEWS